MEEGGRPETNAPGAVVGAPAIEWPLCGRHMLEGISALFPSWVLHTTVFILAQLLRPAAQKQDVSWATLLPKTAVENFLGSSSPW